MQKSIRLFTVVAASAAGLFLAGCQTNNSKPKPAPARVQPAPVVETHQSLSADALFAFGKSNLQSLNEKGLGDLDALVEKLRSARQVNSVQLIGYTDRIGGEEYNQTLSQKRAEAVRDYLVGHGINGNVIHAEGRGEADPVAECPNQKGKKLKACLAPNRRVEVAISAIN